MNDDKALLEAAARAAGVQLADEIDSHIPSGGVWIVGRGGRDAIWDPLRDDGDALRLAVKLNLHVLRFQTMTTVKQITGEFSWDERDDGNPCAATRRAIVRAAASLGQAAVGQEAKHG